MHIPVPFAYLIDDDPINNLLLTKSLKKQGLVDKIISSTTAVVAMAYFRELRERDENFPNVIFIDLRMPGMDGWEFIERFKKAFGETPETKMVVLSGTRRMTDLVRTEMNENVDYFINKPATPGELETMMEELA